MVDHTSELVLRVAAPSYEGLLVEAARAFTGLVPERLRGPDRPEWRAVRIDGSDRARALVDWLNELVYLAESERWAPTQVDVAWSGADQVVLRARGIGLREPFTFVKAATLHDLHLRVGETGAEAEVTLDV